MQRPFLRPLLSALATLAGVAHAQPCLTPTKLTSPSAAASDYFGRSLAMSFGGPNNRPLLAVGKPFADAPGATNVGGWSIWQYSNGTWSLTNDVVNSTGVANERAGHSISISDPYMIVGAPDYQSRGRARILKREANSNTWVVDDDVNPGIVPGSTDGSYGLSVGITAADGGWAIIGAPYFNASLDDSGRVDILYRNAANEWILRHSISSANNALAADSGNLGVSVAISQSSSWVAWGAPGQTVNPQFTRSGTAYVMRRNEFSPTILSRPDSETDMRFGASVAVEGDWLAVGAPKKDGSSQETGLPTNLVDCGAVYMYRYENNAWVHHSTLRAPLPTLNGWFGNSLRMTGNQLVVNEFWRERMYVFSFINGAWSVQATFEDPENNNQTDFGESFAIRDGLLAIGDSVNDANGIVDAGAFYTTTISPAIVSGDTCSNPIPMPARNYSGCTETATPSFGNITSCGLGGSGQGPDVWFRFQPQCDGNAVIDTVGSDYDTVLSVHSQCPDASGGYSIACNDDAGFSAPNNRASLVTFNFQGGQTYLIRVSGYNAASGQYTLRSLISYGVSNDNCASATTIGAGVQYSFNTCSATDSSSPVPLGRVRDVWYRFVAPATGSYNFTTCSSSFDTVITLFNGSQAACPTSTAAMIAQNDNNAICSGNGQQSFLTASLTQGQSVMIRIGGAQTGDFGTGIFGVGQALACDDIDFNNNELFPEDQDVIDFFTVLAGGPCSTNNCNDIDFNNNDLYPEDQDIVDFLTVLAGGTCVR